ncbi:MAG: LysM peptidoglycan-binding domain-containing protein [Acidobacteriota bacterium]
MLLLVSCVLVSQAQEKMTKEEWQNQITENTKMRDDLRAQLTQLNKDIDSLNALNGSLDQQMKSTADQFKALTGTYEASINDLNSKIDALANLSDADLYARKAEIDQLQAQKDDLMKQKLAGMKRFSASLASIQSKLDALKDRVKSGREKEYTVGTWAKDRDCLWNIAKKKDIYANAFAWPKIWQGNRDQIRDPDIIHPGQVLKIPADPTLTDTEKKAVRSYWRKKH